jgi:hypothetical protein
MSEPISAVRAALDRIDTDEFFLPTAIAGGPETVRDVLLRTSEVRMLIRDAHHAMPEILARMKPGGVKHDQSRIALLLVIQAAHDHRADAAVLDYLDRLPDASEDVYASPWHPFHYAIVALGALVGKSIAAGSTSQTFRQRHTIVAKARATLLQKKTNGPPQHKK